MVCLFHAALSVQEHAGGGKSSWGLQESVLKVEIASKTNVRILLIVSKVVDGCFVFLYKVLSKSLLLFGLLSLFELLGREPVFLVLSIHDPAISEHGLVSLLIVPLMVFLWSGVGSSTTRTPLYLSTYSFNAPLTVRNWLFI